MDIRKFIFLILTSGISFHINAQDSSTVQIYNPLADAKKEIADAVSEAYRLNKHVFILAGGNWCKWCRAFEKFRTTDPQLDSAFKASYITVHLNYSKENKNEDVFKNLGFPQRFGFPVFIILDNSGNRIHTQQTDFLEEGNGYNKKKVLDFLGAWSPRALDPESYLKK